MPAGRIAADAESPIPPVPASRMPTDCPADQGRSTEPTAAPSGEVTTAGSQAILDYATWWRPRLPLRGSTGACGLQAAVDRVGGGAPGRSRRPQGPGRPARAGPPRPSLATHRATALEKAAHATAAMSPGRGSRSGRRPAARRALRLSVPPPGTWWDAGRSTKEEAS